MTTSIEMNSLSNRVREFARNRTTLFIRAKCLMSMGKIRQKGQIDRYLKEHQDQRYLRIGAGKHTDKGWLATDLIPERLSVVYMDATKTFPLPSRSFDAVVCEHMIEHVSFDSGLALLRESRRVLRAGGTLRVITPDLDMFCDLRRLATSDPEVAEYVEWSNTRYGTESERADSSNNAFVINRMLREWGHQFIYDESTLSNALAMSGFINIVRLQPGESTRPNLRNVDRHSEEIGEASNRLESLIIEGTVS